MRRDPPPGPFSTEAEVRELPAVREVYEAFRADPGVGKIGPNHRMLLAALAAAGVYLGAYDHAIAEWLANWEPQTVAVIAGWVTRAADGQAADADAEAAVDELLDRARTRDGPRPARAGDHRTKPQTSPEAKESAEGILRPGTDESRAAP